MKAGTGNIQFNTGSEPKQRTSLYTSFSFDGGVSFRMYAGIFAHRSNQGSNPGPSE
jgi:hypothetical protein